MKEILKHFYEEGKKFGYALARGATDLPSVQTFDELYTEQLNKHNVVRGGDKVRESVPRVEPDFNGRNVMRILYTPTEPLPAEALALTVCDGCGIKWKDLVVEGKSIECSECGKEIRG
jgi:hypothetical protein